MTPNPFNSQSVKQANLRQVLGRLGRSFRAAPAPKLNPSQTSLARDLAGAGAAGGLGAAGGAGLYYGLAREERLREPSEQAKLKQRQEVEQAEQRELQSGALIKESHVKQANLLAALSLMGGAGAGGLTGLGTGLAYLPERYKKLTPLLAALGAGVGGYGGLKLHDTIADKEKNHTGRRTALGFAGAPFGALAGIAGGAALGGGLGALTGSPDIGMQRGAARGAIGGSVLGALLGLNAADRITSMKKQSSLIKQANLKRVYDLTRRLAGGAARVTKAEPGAVLMGGGIAGGVTANELTKAYFRNKDLQTAPEVKSEVPSTVTPEDVQTLLTRLRTLTGLDEQQLKNVLLTGGTTAAGAGAGLGLSSLLTDNKAARALATAGGGAAGYFGAPALASLLNKRANAFPNVLHGDRSRLSDSTYPYDWWMNNRNPQVPTVQHLNVNTPQRGLLNAYRQLDPTTQAGLVGVGGAGVGLGLTSLLTKNRGLRALGALAGGAAGYYGAPALTQWLNNRK